ncbi:MAG: hypothetical protein AAGG51_09275 [Cyanobacteria bacterium P01_G01_bin.54]
MSRSFSRSTAEQVVQVVDAVHVGGEVQADYVERFCDFSTDQTQNALSLACDIGLLSEASGTYSTSNILCNFFSTAVDTQKAAALRIALHEYEPFLLFAARLRATGSADTAAQQTKAALTLNAHREEIKDTLISLGTYTGAIETQSGGRYAVAATSTGDALAELASSCRTQDAAEAAVRKHIGIEDPLLDRNEIILPLARALIKAKNGYARDAVTEAAIAFESFLARLALELNVTLTGTSGISTKLDKFRSGPKLPKKVIEACKYIAQLRNAADHGVDVDPDVGAVWTIREESGRQFVFVTCTMISVCLSHVRNNDFSL